MTRALTAYLAAGLTMLVIDAVWLTMMARTYRRLLGDILLDGVRLGPAAAFYLMYVAGIVGLAVLPALREDTGWQGAALMGAFLGLVCYGTYDLTNHATLKTWHLQITVMDMAWGALLTGVAAAAGYLAAQRVG